LRHQEACSRWDGAAIESTTFAGSGHLDRGARPRSDRIYHERIAGKKSRKCSPRHHPRSTRRTSSVRLQLFSADRSDISEELTRLESHLVPVPRRLGRQIAGRFRQKNLTRPLGEAVGRKLDFNHPRNVPRRSTQSGVKSGATRVTSHVVRNEMCDRADARKLVQNMNGPIPMALQTQPPPQRAHFSFTPRNTIPLPRGQPRGSCPAERFRQIRRSLGGSAENLPAALWPPPSATPVSPVMAKSTGFRTIFSFSGRREFHASPPRLVIFSGIAKNRCFSFGHWYGNARRDPSCHWLKNGRKSG